VALAHHEQLRRASQRAEGQTADAAPSVEPRASSEAARDVISATAPTVELEKVDEIDHIMEMALAQQQLALVMAAYGAAMHAALSDAEFSINSL